MVTNTSQSFARFGAAVLALSMPLFAVACSSDPGPTDGDDEETFASHEDEITSNKTVGNWSKFPDGEECLAAVQGFYPARFNASVPIAGPGWTGNCAPHGACHIWLDKIPSSKVWERIPNDGQHVPETYDMIVYPPAPGDPWGHIASVDHVEGKTIFVIDDNYVAHHKKSAHPHTVSTKAYGWYHLKSLGNAPAPAAKCSAGGFYCGGDEVSGSSHNLYECQANGGATLVRSCSHGCEVRPGKDDGCGCVPGGEYCGGDVVNGDAHTLYQCSNDGVSTSVVKHCAKGCSVNKGTNDTCK
jgi:hypothetical protein